MMASLGMEAKSMKDLLVSMPDEVMPCLNKNMRLEFAELQEMGVKAEVKNLLEEVSVMDTLTQDFVQIRMTKASTLQMKKLPVENGDSLLCVVKTFAGPEKESELYFYNQDWKKMDATRLLDGKRMEDLAESLIQKPDTMSETRFAELKAMIEPRMVSALLLQNENSLVVRLSLPLLSADDKKAVNAMIGAIIKIRLSANGGIQSSLKNIFNISATNWNMPPGPTRLGPYRSCHRPKSRRSIKLMKAPAPMTTTRISRALPTAINTCNSSSPIIMMSPHPVNQVAHAAMPMAIRPSRAANQSVQQEAVH